MHSATHPSLWVCSPDAVSRPCSHTLHFPMYRMHISSVYLCMQYALPWHAFHVWIRPSGALHFSLQIRMGPCVENPAVKYIPQCMHDLPCCQLIHAMRSPWATFSSVICAFTPLPHFPMESILAFRAPMQFSQCKIPSLCTPCRAFSLRFRQSRPLLQSH